MAPGVFLNPLPAIPEDAVGSGTEQIATASDRLLPSESSILFAESVEYITTFHASDEDRHLFLLARLPQDRERERLKLREHL
jgi:hypothetical protein